MDQKCTSRHKNIYTKSEAVWKKVGNKNTKTHLFVVLKKGESKNH